MAKPNKLSAGDRIAYAAKFLKNTGQFSGHAPQRRGTFVSYDAHNPDMARVHWDDTDYDYLSAQWGEDYAEDARTNGQMLHSTAIAKVGSPRFASNDL